jgi:hypothetical protein
MWLKSILNLWNQVFVMDEISHRTAIEMVSVVDVIDFWEYQWNQSACLFPISQSYFCTSVIERVIIADTYDEAAIAPVQGLVNITFLYLVAAYCYIEFWLNYNSKGSCFQTLIMIKLNRHNSVGIGMAFGLDCRGSIPDREKNFDLLHSVQTSPGAHPASYPMRTGAIFFVGKAAGEWSWPLASI